jgi:hypothetical protein
MLFFLEVSTSGLGYGEAFGTLTQHGMAHEDIFIYIVDINDAAFGVSCSGQHVDLACVETEYRVGEVGVGVSCIVREGSAVEVKTKGILHNRVDFFTEQTLSIVCLLATPTFIGPFNKHLLSTCIASLLICASYSSLI